MRFSFTVGERSFTFSLYYRDLRSEWQVGFTNRCVAGRYCLFLDYDNVPEEWVFEEVKYLINIYTLGRVYIFKTNKGFHVVSPEKFSLRELVEILRDTSTDDAFKNVPLKFARKLWTLRGTAKKGLKPKLIYSYEREADREISKAHMKYLSENFNIRMPKSKLMDQSENVLMNIYLTE